MRRISMYYENAMKRGLLAMLMALCIASPCVGFADDATKSAGGQVKGQQAAEPPPLSAEVKRLIDGLLEIQRSNTLIFDQRGIERTLGVSLINHKTSKAYARFGIAGLPLNMSGKYEIGSTLADGLGAELSIYFDTQHVCAHLPQVLDYIGKPYIRRLIMFSGEADGGGQKEPKWPGVKDNAWAVYHLGGDNPSKISPHLMLTIQGIECVGVIDVSALLKKSGIKE